MKRFKNILCVVEPGDQSKPALERAVSLAEKNQARLTVVDVIEQTAGSNLPCEGLSGEELQQAMNNFHTKNLQALVAPYRERIEIHYKVLQGTPFLVIIRAVLCHNYDLVIKVTETEDWLTRVFGSDDMHLMRKCPSPVWLIRPNTSQNHQRILAAVDVDESEAGSAEEVERLRSASRKILEMASSLALSNSAELHIVHIWEAIGEGIMRSGFMSNTEEKINTYVEQVRQQHQSSMDQLMHEVAETVGQDTLDYLKPEIHLIKGGVRKEVPRLAKEINADLLVMGTVARTGVPGFIMGNTAESILNQIECSVMAIKPEGFVSPVE
ncbi:MAG: universal stress protein [Gammaproteobacteria bacterium]|nr:universal stress protein [Gammaproteobacteria bacterium]MCF6229306.1 universal stress protein [Gammaproteobacteria bacterium]